MKRLLKILNIFKHKPKEEEQLIWWDYLGAEFGDPWVCKAIKFTDKGNKKYINGVEV